MSNNGENLFLEAEEAEKNYRNALIQYIKASGIKFENFDKVSLSELRQFALNLYSLESEYQQTTNMVSEFGEEVNLLTILDKDEQVTVHTRVPNKGKIGKVFRGK